MKNYMMIALLIAGAVVGYIAYEEWAYNRDVARVHEFMQSWN